MKRKIKRVSEIQVLLESIQGKNIQEAEDLAGFNGYIIKTVDNFSGVREYKLNTILVQLENGIIIKTKIV